MSGAPETLKNWRMGRLQLRIVRYRHVYRTASDRHVFQLMVIYDERRKQT